MRIQHRIEDFILAIVIFMGIFEFFEFLPDYLGYVKKVISWILLGYFMYRLSFTTLFFNDKRVHIDLMIIVSYFLLTIKNFVGYMQSSIEETVVLREFYLFILNNAAKIEYFAFHIGWLLLIFLSLYMAYRLRIGKPSLMEVFHEEGPASGFKDFGFRALTMLVVLVSFFLIVFNLIFDWLVFAVESPLLMIGVLSYVFIIIRHHERFNAEHVINRIGSIGEEFYKGFIGLFHYKEKIALGIIGMLVFHMLTDVGSFIVPYVTGLEGGVYLAQLGEGHTSLLHLLKEDIAHVSGLAKPSLFLVYFFNLFAMLFFLLMPVFIWYRLFKNREIHVSSISLSVIIPSLVSFLLMSGFSIKMIAEKSLVGVDILTKSTISKNIIGIAISNANIAVIFTSVLSLALGIVIFFLDLNKRIRKRIFMATVFIGMIFFVFYISYFLISVVGYYISAISSLFASSYYAIVFYFIVFLIINAIFYSLGAILFIHEIIKNHVFYKSYTHSHK